MRLRKWLYWRLTNLRERLNAYPTHDVPDDTGRRWWELSFSFDGTAAEADGIVEQVSTLLCANPNCGDFGEFCDRDWLASSNRLRMTEIVDDEGLDWTGCPTNSNPTRYTFSGSDTKGENT